MYRDRKIVVVTPAGRRRYLELLVPQVLSYAPLIDEYQLWVNTVDAADIAYMEQLERDHALIKLKRLPPTQPFNANMSIHVFFRECKEPGSVYVRFDDDVIALDSLRAFMAFLDHRIDHPEYFLVYANILNNAIVSHIQQRHGKLGVERGVVGYSCMDPMGWSNGEFAVDTHRTILSKAAKGDFRKFYFRPEWRLIEFERVSINCVSWLGSYFETFDGRVGADEELWLACLKPSADRKMNTIFGEFCVVHFSFYPQQATVEAAGVLESYRNWLAV